MFHVKQSIKLIIIIFILCLCGVYPVKADSYTTNGVYTFSDSSDNTYQLTMPEQEFYNHVSSGVVSNTLAMGATQYTIGQEIKYENSSNNTYLASTVITGTRQGWLDSYAQRFTYENNVSDRYRLFFSISEVRGGSGTVTILYKKNDNWVQFGEYGFNGTYNGEFYVKEITGYRVEVRYTLNSRYAFARPDNAYTDGYKLNDFAILIKDSQTQADETQDKIEENTRNTNTILGTVKNAIDNVKNAIDNVVTGITNLPRLILDGLKDLFIPEDFSNALQDGLEDISDSLGVVGYPIQFINDTLNTIKNTSGESLTVHLPSFSYKGHVIFPSYYRANIFYFGNNLVFSNVNLVTPFTQFFNLFGVDCSTVTVGQLIKILMRFCTGIALIGAIINYYNNIFGTNIDSGEEDEIDN